MEEKNKHAGSIVPALHDNTIEGVEGKNISASDGARDREDNRYVGKRCEEARKGGVRGGGGVIKRGI